jgi:hypothetical protein
MATAGKRDSGSSSPRSRNGGPEQSWDSKKTLLPMWRGPSGSLREVMPGVGSIADTPSRRGRAAISSPVDRSIGTYADSPAARRSS